MPMTLAPSKPSPVGAPASAGLTDPAWLRRKATRPVAIWPIVLVIYATLLPREISIHLGENNLYLDRIAMLLTLPWLLMNMVRGDVKFVLPDWLVLFTAIWILVSFGHAYGFERAMVSGLALSFDAVAAYFFARSSFRSLDDIRRILIVCAPAFFLAALTLPIESISNQLFIHPFFIGIFGKPHLSFTTEGVNIFFDKNELRYGLTRAYGPFDHPILGGLYLATLLGIYWKSGIRGLPFVLATAASLLSFFTVSSAAVLSLVLVIGSLFYDWLTTRIHQLSWPLLLFAVIVGLMLLSLATNSGVLYLLIRFATLDPSTGFFRVAIWQYGTQSVWAHPLYGIAFENYKRADWMLTASVDAHWLLYAMRYGLPAALALFLACIVAIAGLARAERLAKGRDAEFYRGIMITFAIMVIMAFTVTLQGGILTWFSIVLGGCVSCAQHTYITGWALAARVIPGVSAPPAKRAAAVS